MELKIRGKIEIETENGYKIPSTVIELLMEIEQTGSLNAAVNNIEMSYSYAWQLIFKANCQLGQPLLISRKGGNGGGVAELTDAGISLLKQYRKFKSKYKAFLVEQKFIIDSEILKL